MHSRLPISHPDYQYPPAKNIYAEKNRVFDGRIYSDNDTEKHIGQWRELMLDSKLNLKMDSQSDSKAGALATSRRPLHVEIGCNGGHCILELAKASPANAYIGVDYKFKQIHRGAEKAQKNNLNNLLFFRSNAERIHFSFADGEVDHLYLFFPDPWAKKSQLKNRFFTTERLKNLAKMVRKGGTFEVRTDHENYFEWMCEHAEKETEFWQVTEKTFDRHAGNPNAEKLALGEVTLFEKLFIKDGIRIKRMVLTRK